MQGSSPCHELLQILILIRVVETFDGKYSRRVSDSGDQVVAKRARQSSKRANIRMTGDGLEEDAQSLQVFF